MRILLSLCLAISLVACGNSTNTNLNQVYTDIQTGQFVDSPVTGLRYSTATQNGETNTQGEFNYRPGEIVSFYVGDILVGQAVGAATLTPFDLAGGVPPETAIDIRREVNRINKGFTSSLEFTPNFAFRPPVYYPADIYKNHNTPLETAANIAVFLQTLDEDGDPVNGISIPAQMHRLAVGASLDFNQQMYLFARDFSLRKLIAAGRAAGLWGGSRAIRNSFYALDALYAGLGITPLIEATSITQFDLGNDGTVDHRIANTYDVNGYLAMSSFDDDADGIVDSNLTNNFDANGNWTGYELDSNADGSVDSRSIESYDANGNRIRIVLDNNADSVAERDIVFTHDAYGNSIIYEEDSSGDGMVDSRGINTYDANGNLTVIEDDNDADGTIDSRYTFTHDANGNQAISEIDDNGDGTVDYRVTLTYDANGNSTAYGVDVGADGTEDSRYMFMYDANGNRMSSEHDNNGDGTVDSRVTFTYDANGNSTGYEVDDNADGTVNYRQTYSYDANGNRTAYEQDSNGDGVVDNRLTYSTTVINRWAAVFSVQ